MKKWFTILLLAVLVTTVFNHDQSYAATNNKNIIEQNNVKVIINGKYITFKDPILNNSGSLLLPMRDFYEAIGAKVSWNQTSKVASSVRNNQTIDLTINSKTALVNGNKVQVTVPPIVYKDRTYIPMRFVSENSDGQVYWDQVNKVVEVVLNEDVDDGQSPGPGDETTEPSIPEVPKIEYTLYMNNQKIKMDHEVITKDGRMYIPSSYFRDYLQDTYEQWSAKDRLELTISGLHFVFTNNSNKIYVNSELYTGAEKPFMQSGEMYVPVKFIVDSFKNGGTLRYVQDTRTIYISLYDYIMTSDFLQKSYGFLPVPKSVENAALDGKRELFVSDNPEELIPTIIKEANETLAEYKVQGLSTTKEHRVYGWHINKLGDRASIGITIQNTSSTTPLEITNSKGLSQTSSNSWSTFDVGLPLSDAVLTGTLKNAKESTMTIAPGETKVIQAYDIGANYLLGFTHDFDVRPVNGQASYTLRTVISLDVEGNLASIHSPAVPINKYAAHPRGVWPSSSIKATLPAYTVDTEQVGYNISNGKTDHFLTPESSLDPMNGTVGNPGHFGMTYKVDIPIVNDTGKLKYVVVKITGRGGLYSGAVKMNGRTYLIPTLKPGQEYVQLPVLRTSKRSDMINLEIIHAGGSNLPVAVYVETR
ncbi:MAG: stalk domain-containing protein [Solibacillus sp.]|uniref:stalk domain-containing protein n=1 Tax=unclassified Solibacillus TaxID=2637870 RepID=UPI0030FBD20A